MLPENSPNEAARKTLFLYGKRMNRGKQMSRKNILRNKIQCENRFR